MIDTTLVLLCLGAALVLASVTVLIFFLIFYKKGNGSGNGDGDDGGNGGGGNLGGSRLTTSEKQQFLSLHNQYRSTAGATPLNWNDNLAKNAQSWVDHQKNTAKCQMRHPTANQTERNKYLDNDTEGQNLAWFEGSGPGSQGSPSDCIKGWGPDECPNYSPTQQGIQGSETGHFTQLVWKSTTEVGCAKASCGDETLWACNYSPAGNVIMGGVQDPYELYKKNVTKPC